MKRNILTVLLLITLLVTLTACGGGGQQTAMDGDDMMAVENTEESQSDTPTLGDKMKDPEREEELKQIQNLSVGETGDAYGLSVTLNDVTLTEGDEYTELKPGFIIMVLNLTVTNNKSEPFDLYDLSFSLTANGTECDEDTIITSDDGLTLLQDIGGGSTGTGDVCFQVPQNSNDFVFTINKYEGAENNALVYRFDTNDVNH